MSDFLSSLRPSFSFMEMGFTELSENAMENNLQSLDLSNESLLSEQPEEFSLAFLHNPPSFSQMDCTKFDALEPENVQKRKMEIREDRAKRRKESLKESVGGGNSKNGEKQKEVVHVRARRGQATDSHSLAERVRRERINEKMRCLQDLVPGCYKTMGMATMLDEIINYVQSLQNQVEFLSMKLSAASSFYDFNLDVESMGATQQMGDAHNEAGEIEKLERYESYGGLTGFNTTLPF